MSSHSITSDYVATAKKTNALLHAGIMGYQAPIDTPPGLKYMNLTYLASGGDENTWLPFTKVKYYTNAFIVKDDKVTNTTSQLNFAHILCFQ